MMSEALRFASQFIFLVIFFVVAANAVRNSYRFNIDVALFFGTLATVIIYGWINELFDLPSVGVITSLNATLVMALPYLLLRLAEDFAGVSRVIRLGAEAGLAASALVLFAVSQPLTRGITLTLVAYFALLVCYASFVFVKAAFRSRGVTRRRLAAISAGSFLLGLTLFLAGVGILDQEQAEFWTVASRLATLGSGVFYFLGFAPPRWLRRLWQDPEVHNFITRTVNLLSRDFDSAVGEMEQAAAMTLGADGAYIGIWDQERKVLAFLHHPIGERYRLDLSNTEGIQLNGNVLEVRPGILISGLVYAQGKALFLEDATKADPRYAELYRSAGIRTILASPISTDVDRLGVLVVYSQHTPAFAESDLELLQLIANQCAVVLQGHRLVEEVVELRAQARAIQVREDFLSAAAHDLRTPMTTILMQARLIERQAQRSEGRIDPADIQLLVQETRRLNVQVNELLEASRAATKDRDGAREQVDLRQIIQQTAAEKQTRYHRFVVEADEEVTGLFDRSRISSLVDNLLENAKKYSPTGSEIIVKLWEEGDQARFQVIDKGIGIPPADLPRVFERFYRGSNGRDEQFAGMGLGLYICHTIVEEHGGRIWVESTVGEGTTFNVALPLSREED